MAALNQSAPIRFTYELPLPDILDRGDEKLVFESSEAVSVVRLAAAITTHALFYREE